MDNKNNNFQNFLNGLYGLYGFYNGLRFLVSLLLSSALISIMIILPLSILMITPPGWAIILTAIAVVGISFLLSIGLYHEELEEHKHNEIRRQSENMHSEELNNERNLYRNQILILENLFSIYFFIPQKLLELT